MSNLNLAIEVLEKELERQNLLIKTNENIKDKRIETPFGEMGVVILQSHENMLKMRDQIVDAIALLKTHNNG